MKIEHLGRYFMNKFMNKKMRIIFNDFIKNLDNEKNYCKLKSFNFCSNNLPNYNESIIQQYYLLRFLPAYFVEYFHIYSRLLGENFINNKYNILSIGCGCGLDFWGIKFASELNNSKTEIAYTGMDIVEWEYWDSCDEEEYNIIIFPKSVGEFDCDSFVNLKESLKNTSFKKDRIAIIASLRSSRIEADKGRMKDIIKIFENVHGYKSLNDVNYHTCFNKKDNGYDYRINDIVNGFEYPSYIKEYMNKFYTSCQGYKQNQDKCCEQACENVFNRVPITTMSQVNYQIIKLERV
jgi:hypothetical protein